MRILGGLVVVAAGMAANIVAAGVLSLLGPRALALEDGPVKLLAVVAVGALAVTCAVLFLRGCMRGGPRQLQYPRTRRGG